MKMRYDGTFSSVVFGINVVKNGRERGWAFQLFTRQFLR